MEKFHIFSNNSDQNLQYFGHVPEFKINYVKKYDLKCQKILKYLSSHQNNIMISLINQKITFQKINLLRVKRQLTAGRLSMIMHS